MNQNDINLRRIDLTSSFGHQTFDNFPTCGESFPPHQAAELTYPLVYAYGVGLRRGDLRRLLFSRREEIDARLWFEGYASFLGEERSTIYIRCVFNHLQ